MEKNKNELFDPSLSRLNSMNDAVRYVDSMYSTLGFQKFDTAQYVFTASKFTKERFYHGLSHYKFSENWIAYASGKLLWSHLSAIVIPNDILKHSEGLCSQQTIVFMEILKRKKINVRSIGLGYKEGPGHFLSEVYYNGSWRLHDVTLEPQWSRVENLHRSMEYYLNHKDSLYIVYQSALDRKTFDKIIEKVTYGKLNEFPAKRMLFFHEATFLVVYLLPFLFLSLLIYPLLNRKTGLVTKHDNSKSSETTYFQERIERR